MSKKWTSITHYTLQCLLGDAMSQALAGNDGIEQVLIKINRARQAGMSILYRLLENGYLNFLTHSLDILYDSKTDKNQALALIGDIKQIGMPLKEKYYDLLMNFYLSQGESPKALAILDEMEQFYLKPTAGMYDKLIEFYWCRQKNSEAVLILINRMKKAKIRPVLTTRLALLDYYINQKDSQAALAIIKEANQAGYDLGYQHYNALMFFLLNQENYQDAINVFYRIKQALRLSLNGFKHHQSTYEVLALAYVRKQDGQGLLAAIEEAYQVGQGLGLEAYHRLLECLIVHKNDKDALALTDKMQQMGILFNDKTYQLLNSLFLPESDVQKEHRC